MNDEPTRSASLVSRRTALHAAGAAALGAAAFGDAVRAADTEPEKPAVTKGRIKQSIVHWCFQDHWSVEQTCRVAKQLGCVSVELVDPMHWPLLKEHGLTCAIAGSHGFVKGFNDPNHWDECGDLIRTRIDQCAEAGFPSIITFTGMRNGIPDDVGLKNCVDGLKRVIGHAEKRGINLCLEMLNTRDDTHPMKGHPGYQGDHTDYCMEIIRQIGSPRMKLLFDIYHVQIMDGDVMRRLRQCKDVLGHIHTAGNPGRGELDDKQEINYAPIMETLLEIGYDGYVGQEFIPTRDPLVGLREAVALCDV